MEKENLTEGEIKIISSLKRIEKLWRIHGQDLILFNGTSLRKGGMGNENEITSFTGIRGDGGDGGDEYLE